MNDTTPVRGRSVPLSGAKQMKSIPLLRSFWGRPFLDYLGKNGAPVDAYLDDAKLPLDVLENLESACPSRPLYHLIDDLVRHVGIRDVGVKVGAQTRIASLGDFGRLVAQGPTLGDAIETAVALMPAMHSARRLSLTRDGREARLSAHLDRNQLVARSWDDQFVLMMMIDLVRMAAGSRWLPEAVALETSVLQGGGRVCATQAGIRGGASATMVAFPQELLDRRLAYDSEQSRGAIPIDATPLPNEIGASLRSVLEGLIPAGYTDIRTVAEIVGMSRRTLQRQLRDRGDRFSDVLRRTRLSLARRLLDDPSMKVIDVAFELGYSDHAHFTRAFRRWTGLSPRGFRNTRRSPVPVLPADRRALQSMSG